MEPESKPTRPPEDIKHHHYGYDSQSSSLRDTLFVAMVLTAMVAILWILFSGKLGREQSDVATINGKELPSMLLEARRQVDAGHLSWPAEGSALSIYSEALEYFPDSAQAYAGILSIGEQYLSMLDELLAKREIDNAHQVLRSLEAVASQLDQADFNQRLAEAKNSVADAEAGHNRDRPKHATTVDSELKPYQTFRDPLLNGGQGPTMIFIPAATAIIGSPPTDSARDSDEGPQYQTQLRSYAIGQTEVTFAEYDLFAKATDHPLPEDNGWGRGERPVINVSWNEAKRYVLWLTDQTGFRYRLPTESEWEYAAGANVGTRFAYGKCLSPEEANFDDREIESIPGCPYSGHFEGKTVPVKSHKPNAWGLYQVHGNAREWVEDCWFDSYHFANADGRAVYTGEAGSCGKQGQRVLRGGTWNASMNSARLHNRFAASEGTQNPAFGFRLARDVIH